MHVHVCVQSAIASTPTAAWQGYLLGGIMWFCIPFTLSTSLGLATVALDLPLSTDEANMGLVPIAAASVRAFCLIRVARGLIISARGLKVSLFFGRALRTSVQRLRPVFSQQQRCALPWMLRASLGNFTTGIHPPCIACSALTPACACACSMCSGRAEWL